MAIPAGSRLGPYEILSALGAGGMGEVYRARDTKLNRDVALKVLLPDVANDPERLARFRREAQLLASLNHPQIGGIHGLEENSGTIALVLELVDGPTLADRIARGPIPFDEARPIAKQIADALEAAHEQGIVHRDLKPANIKVRDDGTVKVLDFGLAKAIGPMEREASAERQSASMSPTITSPARMTRVGVILGTAAYMSPEQAAGKPVDKRSDFWAFGVVLFEMLTGRSLFDGETVSHVLAAVLTREPDWAALPSRTPATIRTLLRRCLEKDRKRRLDSAAAARLEIDDAMTAPSADLPSSTSARTTLRRVMPLAFAFALGVALAAAFAIPAMRSRPAAAPPVITRFDVVTPPTDDPLSFALSPDGRQLVFVAPTENIPRLWVRPLDQVTPRALAGTDGATYPFWSPDGAAVGFFADGKLKRIDVGDGTPRVLADAPSGRGGSWGRDGFIVFAPAVNGPLVRVPSAGGPTTVVTKSSGSHRWPQILPDGRHLLFWALQEEMAAIYVSQIDGSDMRRVLPSTSSAVYAEGQLLLVDEGVLTARRFDPARNEVGDPITLAPDVAQDQSVYRSGISSAVTGVLAHRAVSAVRRQLVWIDRHGQRAGALGPPDDDGPINPALSPDGRRVVIQRFTGGPASVWMVDDTRRLPVRFSDGPGGHPLWSPDGSRVLYGEPLFRGLMEKAASGSGAERTVAEIRMQLTDWSPDGRVLLGNTGTEQTGIDVSAVPLDGDRKPFLLVQGRLDQRNAQFAPDGRWIAYDSNESGRFEVYVQPFPAAGGPSTPLSAGKWQVSTGGGMTPRWSHDGREMFFIAPDGAMMAAPVRVSADGQAFEPGPAKALFRVPIVPSGGNRHQYSVSPDNQRFLVNARADEAATAPITVVENWTVAAKK